MVRWACLPPRPPGRAMLWSTNDASCRTSGGAMPLRAAEPSAMCPRRWSCTPSHHWRRIWCVVSMSAGPCRFALLQPIASLATVRSSVRRVRRVWARGHSSPCRQRPAVGSLPWPRPQKAIPLKESAARSVWSLRQRHPSRALQSWHSSLAHAVVVSTHGVGGTTGPIVYEVARQRVPLCQDDQPASTVWLVITRTLGAEPPYGYYIRNAPVSTPLRVLVWLSGVRWAITQGFAETKTA